MRYVLAIIITTLILYFMGISILVLDKVMGAAQENINDKLTYIVVGLVPIIPGILGLWLIRVSWRAIVIPNKQ